jgi:hypothetical protein
MIYTDYNKIPYPYLHDAAMVISKRYTLKSIYMDKRGEVCITLGGKLSENAIKDILMNLNPWDSSIEDYALSPLDYSYSNDMQDTYIYSADNLDYRNIEVA